MSVRLVGTTPRRTGKDTRRSVTGVVSYKNRRGIPVALYDTALTSAAYGQNRVMMGDLFNDVMSIIPGWDQRPDWMKKIQIKPDPAKIVQSVAQVLPPKEVGRVVDQANRIGFDLNYLTPAGPVPVTGATIQGAYSNYPMFAQTMQGLSSIPWYVWILGGGLVLIALMPKGK